MKRRSRNHFLLAADLFPLLSLLLLSCGKDTRPLPVPAGDSGKRESLRARAADLIRHGEPRQAMDLMLKNSDLRDPDDAFLLGEAALRGGRYAQAERAYRKVLEKRPDDLIVSMRLARIAFLEARYEDARKQLDWILARSPDHKEARVLRSRIRLRTGDLNGAAADARRWAQLFPEDSEPLCILGMVQRQRGDPSGAVELLKRSLSLDPSNLPARQELARAYVAMGQQALAEETSREALRLEREQRETARRRQEASYHRLQALQALERGDRTAAMKDYADALSHDPDNSEILREAGETALSAGDSNLALKYLERAVKLSPSSAPVRKTRGDIHLARGEHEAALEDLMEAARLDPGDPAVHRSLAQAYQALHRPEAERESALAAELESKVSLPPPPEITP